MKKAKLMLVLLFTLGLATASYAIQPVKHLEMELETVDLDASKEPSIETFNDLDDDDQCTARVTLIDGTVYEVTADSCFKAFIMVLALVQMDLEEE